MSHNPDDLAGAMSVVLGDREPKPESVPPSSVAVTEAASGLYKAAFAILGAGIPLTISDFKEYLTPAMQAVQRAIIKATTVAELPALERRSTSGKSYGTREEAEVAAAQIASDPVALKLLQNRIEDGRIIT